MHKAVIAGALAALALMGCDRDSRPPEQPSPGAVPKPTVSLPAAMAVSDHDDRSYERGVVSAAPASRLFSAPGSLPAAERHFELFQRLSNERAPVIKASLAFKGVKVN